MSKCLTCCCDKPAVAQCLTRLGVGALFLVPGIMKFMDPAMFQGMLGSLFGWTGLMLTIGFWVVVAFEILGGLFVITGPFISKGLYKLALFGIFAISLVALVFVHIPAGELMQILFQAFATLIILALFVTNPLCPFCSGGVCRK